MIVEVFTPEDYLRALDFGIKYPAFCVWDLDCLVVARKFKFPIVTMDATQFFNNNETIELVQDLHNSGVTILLFWKSFPDKDKEWWLRKYLGKTVSKIYTERWSPAKKPGIRPH